MKAFGILATFSRRSCPAGNVEVGPKSQPATFLTSGSKGFLDNSFCAASAFVKAREKPSFKRGW